MGGSGWCEFLRYVVLYIWILLVSGNCVWVDVWLDDSG